MPSFGLGNVFEPEARLSLAFYQRFQLTSGSLDLLPLKSTRYSCAHMRRNVSRTSAARDQAAIRRTTKRRRLGFIIMA